MPPPHAPDPKIGPASRPPRPPAWEAGLLAALLVAAGAAALWWSHAGADLGGRSASRYVGTAGCRECHPAEVAAHARSGHSRTLLRVAGSPLVDRLDGVTVADPERPGVTWSYRRRGDDLVGERREADSVVRSVLEYALGSGRHATTFVTLDPGDPDDPALLEHRMTLFAHQPLPGVTPGQSLAGKAAGNTPAGRHHGRSNTLKCFDCHATIISDRGPGVLDPATMIPNVGCERCHGPARDHVAAARAGQPAAALRMPMGSGHATPAEELAACGQCHRLPGMIAAGPASIVPANATLVRHQPVGLMQSACYTRTGGGLACSTCHDPHARPATDAATYEAACLKCHGGPQQTACPENPLVGCVGCHMPRRDTTRGMQFTDHWIRTRPLAEVGQGSPDP